MSQLIPIEEHIHLQQSIISQCTWSDTYSSVKHILTRTANQLPLLISFSNTNDNDNHKQIIFFFDRNVSQKLLFTPLKQLDDRPNQFKTYPTHCTFAMTDLFKGAFEFVRDGQRCSRIFKTLRELVDFSTNNKCSVVFMSRDSIHGYYPDSNTSTWTSNEYVQGSVFEAQRIHRSPSEQKFNNDHLECLDEDGYTIFLKMNAPGRFSLIATSPNQQKHQPELYLHSTQTANVAQLIQRLTSDVNIPNNNNCIRLVRGPVPHNFHCQYLQLKRQHTHDVLVGITEENLVVEWNLESYAPCSYATNLNDILNKLSDTYEEQLLENCIDQARQHYRENFQKDMQLISTRDWKGFFQYWQWIDEKSLVNDKHIPYQSVHRFHLVASIQDLSDNAETLLNQFKKPKKDSLPSNRRSPKRTKSLTTKQQQFLAEMDRILTLTPKSKANRKSLPHSHTTSLLITAHQSPFDDSIYDSNTPSNENISKTNQSKPNARRTQ